MTVEITSTGTVLLQLVGEYSAEELTALIHELGEARARIAPNPSTFVETRMPVALWPHWHTQLAPQREQDTLIAFNHPNFGWLGFVLPAQQRVQLAGALIAQQVVNMPPDQGVVSATDLQTTAGSGGSVH